MIADPGPAIPDYVDEHFQDAEPYGAEVEALFLIGVTLSKMLKND